MELRDYVSLIALVLSVASLTIAYKNSSFSRRTKLAELRVTMLVKVAETSLSNSRAKRICAEFVRAVTRNNDTHLLASLEMPEISDNDKDLDLLYRNIADAPVTSVGGAYEEIFHKLYILSVRAQEIENRLSAALKTYESELACKS